MNFNKYKVIVPFNLSPDGTLTGLNACELPREAVIGDVRILKIERGKYAAEQIVATANKHDATVFAIRQLENILYLFAVNNDGFQIDYGSRIGIKSLHQDGSDIKTVIHSDIKKTYKNNAFIPNPYVTITKLPEDFSFEESALSWSSQWPDWFRSALELNYIAVTAKSTKTALITLYSAIEIITKAASQESSTIVKTYFKGDSEHTQLFIDEIQATFKKFNIKERDTVRLIQQIQNVHVKGNVDRIHEALNKCGVKLSLEEIKYVTKLRGVTHPKSPIDSNSIRKAKELAQNWVQYVIRQILESKVEVIA